MAVYQNPVYDDVIFRLSPRDAGVSASTSRMSNLYPFSLDRANMLKHLLPVLLRYFVTLLSICTVLPLLLNRPQVS